MRIYFERVDTINAVTQITKKEGDKILKIESINKDIISIENPPPLSILEFDKACLPGAVITIDPGLTIWSSYDNFFGGPSNYTNCVDVPVTLTGADVNALLGLAASLPMSEVV